MPFKYFVVCFILLIVNSVPSKGQTIPPEKMICGRWESVEKNLIVVITMEKGQYKTIIDWFDDTEGKPLDYWTDRRNPNPELRSRKIHGMSILRNLTYHPKSNSWEDGMIYDSKHGREWNASAYIDKAGQLHVKGYWHFKFIGRTMIFRRLSF